MLEVKKKSWKAFKAKVAVQGKIAKSSRMVGALRPISVTDKPNSQKKNIEDFNTISNPHQWSLIEPWTQCYFQAHRKHLQKKKNPARIY